MTELWNIFYKIITCQSWNSSHTKTKTMELKKFNNINTENPVNNNRNVPDIIKEIW